MSWIMDALEEVKSGKRTELELLAKGWGTELIVRFGWDEEAGDHTIHHDEWVVLVGGEPLDHYFLDTEDVAKWLEENAVEELSFIVEAERYFASDAETLAQVKPGDLVLVHVDFITQKADYTWYPAEGNPAEYTALPDDFHGVLQEFSEEIKEEIKKEAV